ncbi:right-handed parallel beta-helix repeat-containing protein [Puniceicoccales bacterium CK1056]|uniref:Right-handed parallel beta-helix repeat-containing protein n=1 Tax=Oceanipulchritudo coccoides TaxID=2706888 RepID=A0A6B2LZT0_9BACT|nr:right-handed parallel beta-helix repeat-containing protein [Oceanipulchritudo coccoides]NDV61559.1 right-handed parallel beta-helix repeat-containing protein [Oceanipulchritudo coccoides]
MNRPALKTLSKVLIGSICAAMAIPASLKAESESKADILNVADYDVLPDGGDCTPALRKALEKCRESGATTLLFPEGRYDFHPDLAEEIYLYISNNDEGLKRVVFPLVGFENLKIDGQGSEFVFHGFISPFLVEDSSNITLTNFSVDFDRPFHSEAIIIGWDEDGMEVEIPQQFPYEVRNGLLTFTSGEKETGPLTTVSKGTVYGSGHMLEFDTEKRETAYMARDYYFKTTASYPVKKLDGRKVLLRIPNLVGTPGNTLVFGPNHRKHPGFVLTRSSDITFESVTIHHAGGMGILGQLTHNISINNCKVTPSNGRMLSTTADATHFVNCTGYIKLTNNLFENQKDDATNIHGIYAQVTRKTAPNQILIQLKHRQQHGFDLLRPGTEVEFVTGKSLISYGRGIVKEFNRINKEYMQVTLEEEAPAELVPGDAIATIRDYPEVTIANNIIRNNRARGMLLNCRGKTVVENNTFHTPGAAILFEGDAFFWFEQGGVTDCVIRNNIFENCLFGVWGKAIIDVKAGIHERKEESRYNRNIRIEDNTFRVFDDTPLLNVYCVDGLTWKNNTVEKTDAYSPTPRKFDAFNVTYSDNVSIDTKNPY